MCGFNFKNIRSNVILRNLEIKEQYPSQLQSDKELFIQILCLYREYLYFEIKLSCEKNEKILQGSIYSAAQKARG